MATPISRPIEAGAGSVPVLKVPTLPGLEPLYSPQEIADYLKIDVSTVRRLFLDRPNVIQLGRPEARGRKRQYCTLRIPLSELQAFLRERTR